MRPARCLFILVLSGFFLLIWGCIEYTITTQVMPDGRLMRTISVKGDSAAIFRGSFYVPSDSGWKITKRYEHQGGKDSAKGSVYVYEATRMFQDFNELNSCFYKDTGFNEHINIKVQLTKKKRWFYNFYTYKESYTKLFPFRSVPIEKFMTPADLRLYASGEDKVYYSPASDSLKVMEDSMKVPLLTGKDSLRSKQLREALDHRFELWQKTNIYYDFYAIVCKAIDKLGKSSDTINARAPFYHWLDSTRVFESVMDNPDAFITAAATFFRINPLDLHSAVGVGYNEFSRKFKVAALTLESYTNQVLMPGMILKANTKEIKGNLVIWHFKITNFYASDYVMTARSRNVNKMTVVFAAIIFAMLIGFALLMLFRKKILPPELPDHIIQD